MSTKIDMDGGYVAHRIKHGKALYYEVQRPDGEYVTHGDSSLPRRFFSISNVRVFIADDRREGKEYTLADHERFKAELASKSRASKPAAPPAPTAFAWVVLKNEPPVAQQTTPPSTVPVTRILGVYLDHDLAREAWKEAGGMRGEAEYVGNIPLYRKEA